MDTQTRSIAKTVTFRLWTFVMITLMLWLWFDLTVTQSFAYVLTVNLLQTLSYYVHERIWDGISWGQKSRDPASRNQRR